MRRKVHKAVVSLLCVLLALGALSAMVKATSSATTQLQMTQKEIYPQYPQVNYGTGPQADLIKRGEYLVKAGDCIACHTDTHGVPFAGGLPIVTPFGTMYVPNITPDKETGIGSWSNAQFIKAMKQGIAPNGSYYFPAFPYPSFSKVTDEDIIAIKAYLDVIPPVHKVNRPLDMPWPFRVRFFQIFWRILFFDFDSDTYKNNPQRSEQWNRGAYLVQGLGHCGMCHTQLNFLGAEKKKYALTGGFFNGFYAPNISESALKDVDPQEIIAVFKEDKLIGGGNVQGPMLEVNHDSLSYLTDEDLLSIAAYIKTVQSKTPPKPKSSGTVNVKEGKEIYGKYCVGCHSTGAGGAPKIGDQAAWAPRIQLGVAVLEQNAIKGIGAMPPKGGCDTCSETDIQSAVQYIISESKGTGAASTTTTTTVPAQSPTSLIQGKQVYNQVCSICHTNGQLGAPKLGDQAAWAPLIKQNMDVLVMHAIEGYKGMPPKGACYTCTDADIIAAVKYMVQESKSEGDFSLW